MNVDKELLNQNKIALQKSINRFLKTQHKGTPLAMSFIVTNRCNLSCKHCFYHYNASHLHDADNQELTIDEYRKVSKSMGIIMKAIFSGGEPFLREDLHEIIHIFHKNNKIFWISSSTNGQYTDKIINQVEKIVTQNPYCHFSLALSLDGFEEQHDFIRGKGTFQKALNTWRELQKLCKLYPNLEIYICPTVNSVNKQIMPKFINWCVNELKPAFVPILKIRQNPRDGDYLKDVNCNEYKLCKQVIEKQILAGNMGDVNKPQTYITSSTCSYVYETMKSGKRKFKCFAGKHGAFMDYDGTISVCEVMESLGNIRDYNYDFHELWDDESNKLKRNMVGKHPNCEKCTHETEGIIPSIFYGTNEIKVDLQEDE